MHGVASDDSTGRWKRARTTLRLCRTGLILLCALSLAPAAAGAKAGGLSRFGQASFTRLMVSDGLAENTVRAVVQDRDGFIWVGTQDGLDKYDGYNFTVLRHDPQRTDSLSANVIHSLAADHGTLWIGTGQLRVTTSIRRDQLTG